jgi:glutathione S-transferase
MAKLTLTYFDFSGSRGEECRLALAVAGVPFEDRRIQRADWPELKLTLPFRSMPTLEEEGKDPLSQSNTILGLIGRRYGLLPTSDDWECARHESILAACEDLRGRVTKTFGVKDPEELKAARAELVDGDLTTFAECFEAQVRGPYVGGQELSVADIKLFVVMSWIKKGVLDHIPPSLFDNYPKLTALYRSVESHPKIEAWVKKSAA